MKITCEQASLAKGVNIVSKAVPVRSTMPILECILIDASTNRITMTGNDMELGIETVVEGTIEERGVVALDAKFFAELIRKIPNAPVTIETDETWHTTITCEKTVVRVPGKSGEDFAYIPVIPRNNPVVISQMGLRDLIRQTTFAAALNNNNKLMTGEYMEIVDSRLKAVTLDGNRIAIRNVVLGTEADDSACVVPVKALNEVGKILDGGADDLVNIYFTENHVIFEFNDTTVVSRLIDGEYFKIDHMISSDFVTKMTCNKKALLDSIDRSTIMSREADKKPIVFRIEGQTLSMSIESIYGTMNEEMEVAKEGADMIIGFNPKYLIDALRVIDDEDITFYLLNTKSPAIIKDDEGNYTYVVLPINISVR